MIPVTMESFVSLYVFRVRHYVPFVSDFSLEEGIVSLSIYRHYLDQKARFFTA